VLDNRLDRLLSSFLAALTAFADGLPDPHELVRAARRVREDVLPGGIQAIVHATHPEEAELVDQVVKRLRSEHAAALERLGLTAFVDQLAGLNAEFRAAVAAATAGDESGPSYDQVRAAQARGQEMLLELMAMALGACPGREPPDLERRARLVGAILSQNEAIGVYRKNRRSIPDVDPGTGEVVPAPLTPAPG
jgi:hypothetical protein